MRKLVFVALFIFAAAGAPAAPFSTLYVIPVAAHAPGQNGTVWRTDVSIQNIQADPVTIEFAVIESGEGLSGNVFPVVVATSTGGTTVTVPPGGSVTLYDILKAHRGRPSTVGALLLGGDKPFAVTSRTFDQTSNGTLGQAVAAIPDGATDQAGAPSTLYIPGLVQNGAFRTNLGLVMSGSTAMTVSVTINGANGAALGSRTFTVLPGVTNQVQFSALSVAPATFDVAGAVIRISAGQGSVIAYASIVDNQTGDASFISGGTAVAGTATQSLSRLLSH